MTVFLSACTTEAETKTVTITSTATSTTTTPEVFELKWASDMTPESDVGKMIDSYTKMVDEYTEGRVKIEIYYSETLGKSADALDMLNGGVCDIVSISPGGFANDFPMLCKTSFIYHFKGISTFQVIENYEEKSNKIEWMKNRI